MCETLIIEREVRASNSARAPDLGALLGEVERLRAEPKETGADNKQLMHNPPDTVSELQMLQGRDEHLEEPTLPSDPGESFDTSKG